MLIINLRKGSNTGKTDYSIKSKKACMQNFKKYKLVEVIQNVR